MSEKPNQKICPHCRRGNLIEEKMYPIVKWKFTCDLCGRAWIILDMVKNFEDGGV